METRCSIGTNNSRKAKFPLPAAFYTAASSRLARERKLPPITPAPKGPVQLPALAQERIWEFSRTAPTNLYYNVPLGWAIFGPLDVSVLQQALTEILERHQALRSNFRDTSGQLQAIIHDHYPAIEVRTIDDGSLEERRAAALSEIQDAIQKPFDLEKDCLVRALLVQYGPAARLFVLIVHQIVFDGTSLLLLGRELKELYTARLAKCEPQLPHLPVGYYDFALWQRSLVDGGLLNDEETFWKDQFSKPYAPLPLSEQPASWTSTPAPTERQFFTLPPLLYHQLTQFSRESQRTIFTLLLAAFQSHLHFRTGHDDITVFATISGRDQAEVRKLIGLIANVVPVRMSFAERLTFAESVAKANAVLSSAIANQALPLSHILRHIHLAPSAHSGGLFQAALLFQNASPAQFSIGETKFEPLLELENGFGRFGIQLAFRQSQRGLEGSVECRSDLLGHGFASEFADEFGDLLSLWLRRPNEALVDRARPGLTRQTTRAIQTADGTGNRGATGQSASSAEPISAARNQLEELVVKAWEKTLNVSPVGIHDNFFQLGGDSFLAVQLMLEIEKITNKKIPLVTLFEARTPESLARLLRDDGWKPRWSSLVPIKAGGSQPPFYCVHGVGGNILEFEHFSRYIDKDQPLYGIQAQGLDGSSPRHRTVEEMASHYVKEIREFQPEGPYYLGGSSFGGTVAFEIAQQLHARNERVALLVMFDTWAPGYLEGVIPTTGLRRRLMLFKIRFELHWSNFWIADGRERIAYVKAKLVRLWNRFKIKGRRHYAEWQERIHGVFQPKEIKTVRNAGYSASSLYIPKPYAGRITLLRASHQPPGVAEDSSNGWGKFAMDGVEVYEVPGHHGSIMRDPRARILVERLTFCLNRAHEIHQKI